MFIGKNIVNAYNSYDSIVGIRYFTVLEIKRWLWVVVDFAH